MFEKAEVDPRRCTRCGCQGISLGVWKGTRKWFCVRRTGGCGLEWSEVVEPRVMGAVLPFDKVTRRQLAEDAYWETASLREVLGSRAHDRLDLIGTHHVG